MKKGIKICYILAAVVLLFASCDDEPVAFGSDARPGLNITYSGETDEVIFTKDISGEVTAEVDISGKFYARPSTDFDQIVVEKVLVDNNFNEIERTIAISDLAVNDSIAFSITSMEELFEGFTTAPSSLMAGSKILFEQYGVLPSGDIIQVNNDITFDPDYLGYCDLPALELGTWVATNTTSSFSKDVELLYDEVNEVYYFTDFGLDWSNWEDFWYGTMFTLICPTSDSDPVQVKLAGWGADTGVSYEMKADDGTTESRTLRLMPYTYQANSPTGYYDASTGEIIFNNSNFTDAWWGADVHNNVSIKFKKK